MSFELNRRLAAKRPALPTQANIDPVTAAIIRGALGAVNPIVMSKEGAWEAVVANHGRLVEAIERRDPNEAEIASLALIDFTAGEVGGKFSAEPPTRV